MEWIIAAVVSLIISAVVLIVVDKLNLGLAVGGFMNAIIAAIVIGIVNAVVIWLLGYLDIDVSMSGGIVNAIIYFVIAALAIFIAAKILPGLETSGYVGALIAAIAIAVIIWLIQFIVPVDSPLSF